MGNSLITPTILLAARLLLSMHQHKPIQPSPGIVWEGEHRFRIKISDCEPSTYDMYGHLVQEQDANGNTISRTYDSLGRTLAKTVIDAEWFNYYYLWV